MEILKLNENKSVTINKKEVPFDRSEEWPFVKKRNKYDTRNDDLYIKWILATLRNVSLGEYGTDELGKNEKWNATCIYMSKRNSEYLHNYLDPMVWLSYSPVEVDDMPDDQLIVDLNNLTEKR